MELADTLPRDAIKNRIGDYRETIGFTDAATFIRQDKPAMSMVGLYVWDQMVARKAVADPRALERVYPHNLEKMAQFIKRELRRDWITDAFTTQLVSPLDPDYPFAELQIFQCYPGDIFINDVEFSDITRRLDVPTQGIGARRYHGLGVFPVFLERVKQVARERGLNRISLMAASNPAHHVFSRYGFVVGDGARAQMAYDELGFSHPMLLKL